MKNLIFYCLLIVFFFAACKKDIKTPVSPVKTNPVVFQADSASYTIDGKTYTLDNQGAVEVGNTEADRKLDSVADNNHYYISGNKDSIFFYRTFNLRSSKTGDGMALSFFKKYAAKDMVSQLIYYPVNQADLFKTGDYQFGTDFTRENATNGVALAVNGIGQTYSNAILGTPSAISPASENGASFEILNFKQIENDQYLLEAKFNAMIFDSNGPAKQLTNGYVRITVVVAQ